MDKIIIKGRLEFVEEEAKEYSRDFTATLTKSAAFDYGNGTMVTIVYGLMNNGRKANDEYLDTRYSKTIRKDRLLFEQWIKVYLYENKRPCIVTIY